MINFTQWNLQLFHLNVDDCNEAEKLQEVIANALFEKLGDLVDEVEVELIEHSGFCVNKNHEIQDETNGMEP